MSRFVTRPPVPVPSTEPISIPCSSAIRRTTGDERARSTVASSGISSPCTLAIDGARTGSAYAPLPLLGRTGACSGIAGSSETAPASWIRQRPAPTATVVPGSTIISTSTPETGAGSSALALSVSSSTSESYFSIRSPTCFNQVPTIPSTTLSPSCGIVIVVSMFVGIAPSLVADQPAQRGADLLGVNQEGMLEGRTEWHGRNIRRGKSHDRGIEVRKRLLPDHCRDFARHRTRFVGLGNYQNLTGLLRRLDQ